MLWQLHVQVLGHSDSELLTIGEVIEPSMSSASDAGCPSLRGARSYEGFEEFVCTVSMCAACDVDPWGCGVEALGLEVEECVSEVVTSSKNWFLPLRC